MMEMHILYSDATFSDLNLLMVLLNCMICTEHDCMLFTRAGLIAAGTLQPVSLGSMEQPAVRSQVECESSNVENTEPGRLTVTCTLSC